ncbi:ABC transporter ATP-binding protein [Alkalicoccus daliensis]|uniref:Iron complex transport system ATP-binding protein n=1 Tax=Alkalicoccus daliensis TaxID=745820 RepID=A0A1H0G146_9BACI|nr:ABC transporter ATP-binding protein [Alkalicoccus daliensis]SDO00554.1 iron complex transport system ATP-binding protein [Alkalicoccus daliensis]
METEIIVSVKNATVQKEGKKLIDDISWEILQGEHWGVLGLNGSGKTTLLKIIAGAMWPKAGSGPVNVLGERYGNTYMPELKKSIGWVSQAVDQQYQLHPDTTALEIVLSGKHASIGIYEPLTEEDVSFARSLLQKFRIDHLEEQPLAHFSQGERKKAMLARAWMAKPKLLILDEPCAGLDIYAREELLDTLEEMMNEKGPSLIYVTHHLEEVIPSITHTLLLKSGEITASGKKRETLTEENIFNTFQVPVKLEWENNRPWVKVEKL